ncbi:putative sphingosine kinase A B [Leptomonas seymouri]|uniref:Putative sphingosine kinase A B n=1 Tax=Leptomonas seymouri TaxID=5684 RepID=A0A0N0P530_LEPSE|nr:putative sphingosine kinase A B [Leptomonas seymouri]|eukprot:KPI85986.1 putative sphingosine kinase A B [Leptomonas seymouri]
MPSQSAVATSSSLHKPPTAHRRRRQVPTARPKPKSKLPKKPDGVPAVPTTAEPDSSTAADIASPPSLDCVASTHVDPTMPVCSIDAGADATRPSVQSGSRAGVKDSMRADSSKFSPLRLMQPGNESYGPATPPPHRDPCRAGPAGGRTSADMTAVVHAKGHTCKLTYSPTKDSLHIARTSKSGNIRTVLNIPVHMIINIETAAEKEDRQRARQTNDEAVKLVFADSSGGAGLLCTHPTGTTTCDAAPLVFAHSRVNTDISASGSCSYGGVLFQQNALTSPLGVCNWVTSPLATPATQIRCYVHYVRQRNRERLSIHTLELLSHGPAEHMQTVVNALVQRIYRKGPKHILIFISPKSGKGKGEQSFDKHVRPLLHFSRHTYQTYITQRAHDCEDYVADLSHPMNANTVVAAVGGDGMVNEVVNGLHRRKLAYVQWLRSITVDVLPCNLTEDSSQRLSDGGSSNAWGLDPQALATMSDGTSSSAFPKAASSPDPQHANPTIAATMTAAGALNRQPELEENKRCRCASPDYAAAVEAWRFAQRLVEEGWDALMPLIATVPTGSACGMAKSLDVLSIAQSAMALVHLTTVHMDLLHMCFTPNKELKECQKKKLSLRKLTAAKEDFSKYCKNYAAELHERAEAETTAHQQQQSQEGEGREEGSSSPISALSAADTKSPFLKDGSNVYTDEVNYALKMPYFANRVAFMSLSFGTANDIDHGSEPLRWMGNTRFHVYGGYLILLGLRCYRGVLRYLPWRSKSGKTMEKLHSRHTMPSTDDFPLCTMRDDCPHCQDYTFTHCGQFSLASSNVTEEKHTVNTPRSGRERAGARCRSSAAATLAPYTDAELLDEDSVDFSDPNMPWVTIRGEFCTALICNVRDIAQDMLMAPLSHLSDGAIDVVYCRIDPCTGKGGRIEMVKFFMALESGKHVDLDFVNYVKARAVEMKVDEGILMSDGELMPLSSVRITKLRSSIQVVRNE